MVELDELAVQVGALADTVDQLAAKIAADPDQQCTAENPHPGQLSYQRGPNIYICRCGMRYAKNGAVLREVD